MQAERWRVRPCLSGGDTASGRAPSCTRWWLAVVAALINGRLTRKESNGQRLSANLQELHGAPAHVGSMWSTLIVAQVAVAVAILPAAVFLTWYVLRMELPARSAVVYHLRRRQHVLSDDAVAPGEGLVRRCRCADVAARGEPGGHRRDFSSALPGPRPDRPDRVPAIHEDPRCRRSGSSSFRVAVNLCRFTRPAAAGARLRRPGCRSGPRRDREP